MRCAVSVVYEGKVVCRMCGRYCIADDDMEIHAIIAALGYDKQIKTGEIFPTDIVPAITAGGTPRLMQWGFARYNGGGKVINARSETAAEKKMFARSLRERRCLLPASYYYEWQRNGGAKKQKFAISLPESGTLYMAGVYREEKGITLPVFVILTRAAAPSVSCIHDRMPVILPKSVQTLWLESGDAPNLLTLAIQDVLPVPAG